MWMLLPLTPVRNAGDEGAKRGWTELSGAFVRESQAISSQPGTCILVVFFGQKNWQRATNRGSNSRIFPFFDQFAQMFGVLLA
jgi:hypothetical protein